MTDLESPAGRPPSAWGQFLRCHLPMLVVSLVVVAAIVLVISDRWRRGALFFGGATLLAATFRLCLPTARVGLLAVRSRPFDVAALSLLGSAIVMLAATISSAGVG